MNEVIVAARGRLRDLRKRVLGDGYTDAPSRQAIIFQQKIAHLHAEMRKALDYEQRVLSQIDELEAWLLVNDPLYAAEPGDEE